MNMCQKHWDKLREAIKSRGLGSLISETGEQALQSVVRETTVDNYDPLMAAFVSIGGNGMQFITDRGGDPLTLMVDDPNRPFDKCTVCYLNWIAEQHSSICNDPECRGGDSYEWMIDRAADDQVEAWRAMQ